MESRQKHVRKAGKINFDPPLDFTFLSLASITDCLEEEPRSSTSVQKTQTTSNGQERQLVNSNAIRLSNNVISEWDNFSETLAKLVIDPQAIEWIDLSFNDITSISKCLLDFPNLKVLYLHGNGLESLQEIDKLCQLQFLKTLTLHGNPIEETCPSYRNYVLSKLLQLRKLDFSVVTKQDRECAQTWKVMYKRPKRRIDY